MTFSTNRNNIKPEFRLIALMVMILLCLIEAIMAFQIIGPGQCAGFDSPTNNITCVFAFWVTDPLFVGVMPICIPALLALVILFVSGLTFFGLHINFIMGILAYLAVILMSVFSLAFFGKLRKWLNFFASATFLRYDGFRHKQFLTNWLCLEPLEGRSLCGSLYYNMSATIINRKQR